MYRCSSVAFGRSLMNIYKEEAFPGNIEGTLCYQKE
jgi:hypothetical protein